MSEKRYSIKIREAVYNDLETLRGKRETFSQCIERLLTIFKAWQEVSEAILHRPEEKTKKEVKQ